MTSSNTSKQLFSRVISLNSSRYPDTGGIQPILPATGSTIMQAISFEYLLKVSFTASRLLKGSTIVSLETDSGIPGEPDIPNVRTPLPAFAKRASECPW